MQTGASKCVAGRQLAYRFPQASYGSQPVYSLFYRRGVYRGFVGIAELMNRQFQAGAFDPWGGPGFDQCAALLNNEFERVFYKNNLSFQIAIFNLYMVRVSMVASTALTWKDIRWYQLG